MQTSIPSWIGWRARVSPMVLALVITCGVTVVGAANWPEWRGPNRDGTSAETNLPERWSPAGENVAWSLPFGGRSTPVVFGNRLYLQTITAGATSLTQERLVAVDVDTGRIVWEKRYSIYLSDVPQHRAGWASPAVDPDTGNIVMFTVAAELIALSPTGEEVWKRSLSEEYGAITTHGGRTVSPIIEGDTVILNTLLMGWGDLGRPGNRYFAFDKRTGHTVWVSAPQNKHYDTNYATPIVADVAGQRLIIVGGTDGTFHAMQVATGKPVWSLEVSKRAILNSVLFRDNTVYITHGEENIDTTEMGMVAAVDAVGSGVRTGSAIRWKSTGFMPTFSSPVMDRDRLYVVDNGAVLAAFDLKTGTQAWTRSFGTLQKGSPVLADGKIYLGTENGKFYILRPSATGVEVLDEDIIGDPADPDPIVASPAVADGRIYVTSMNRVYAIGTRRAGAAGPQSYSVPPRAGSRAEVAQVQVLPQEVILDPGGAQSFTVKLFDGNGVFVRDAAATEIQWSVEQLPGAVGANGRYTAAAGGAAGYVRATVGGVTGQARLRVLPALPLNYDFESLTATPAWWTANLKMQVTDFEGGKVLLRPRDETVGRRARLIIGRGEWTNYTVEADVHGVVARRQRGDPGLINQRYVMVLFGNGQRVELHPWQAADEMTVRVPFAWDADTWYRMKLRVEPRADGTTLVQGKVWKRDDAEPAAWTIEKIDSVPHRHGAPGLYGDGISNLYFDNLRVYANN
ncbi:MAG TPA: PQQ-binding-like beta-propeller repeat protein [Vicinamibacterales bacterium]|nr:PQQ-binding-like beta-propeller repeat protein [Vicinamibacterales bacterium]